MPFSPIGTKLYWVTNSLSLLETENGEWSNGWSRRRLIYRSSPGPRLWWSSSHPSVPPLWTSSCRKTTWSWPRPRPPGCQLAGGGDRSDRSAATSLGHLGWDDSHKESTRQYNWCVDSCSYTNGFGDLEWISFSFSISISYPSAVWKQPWCYNSGSSCLSVHVLSKGTWQSKGTQAIHEECRTRLPAWTGLIWCPLTGTTCSFQMTSWEHQTRDCLSCR